MAQIPVTDVGNLFQNTIQSVHAILSVANQVLELTQLGDIILENGDFEHDLLVLQGVLSDANGLYYDLQSLERQFHLLFDMGNPPRGTRTFRARNLAYHHWLYANQAAAFRVQTLIHTVFSTISRIQRLYRGISHLIGNLQAEQMTNQWLGKLAQMQTQQTVQIGAWQQAVLAKDMDLPWLQEAIPAINAELMSDMPTSVEGR